ncbi:MAG: hypothetical protein AAB538_04285, partial [Patescibacteria group bacterium]
EPATKSNLADLQEDNHLDLTQAEERLRKDLMSKETGKEILEIVKSIDKKLKPLVDLPEEVTKLKNEVFKLKLRR